MIIFPRMLLPHDKSIDAKVLAQIYNNTTATYKFYWFASILDILVKEGKNRMSFWEIIVGMIAEAWYPIHYFRLSFGKSDSLYKQIIELQQILDIPIDASKSHIKRSINDNFENRQVRNCSESLRATYLTDSCLRGSGIPAIRLLSQSPGVLRTIVFMP